MRSSSGIEMFRIRKSPIPSGGASPNLLVDQIPGQHPVVEVPRLLAVLRGDEEVVDALAGRRLCVQLEPPCERLVDVRDVRVSVPKGVRDRRLREVLEESSQPRVLTFDLAFVAVSFRDVRVHREHARPVGVRRGLQEEPPSAVDGRPRDFFGVEAALGLDPSVELFDPVDLVSGNDVLVERLADDLVGVVPEHLGEPRVDVFHHWRLAVPLDFDHRLREVLEERLEAPSLLVEPAFGPYLTHCVGDPVGQEFVLIGPRPLLEVVGDAGGDRVACDGLAALTGEEDEREVRVCLPDGGEKLDPVYDGHLVIGHDTVEVGCVEALSALAGVVRGLDGEPIVLPFEELRSQVRKPRFVVHVENPNRVRGTTHTYGTPLHPIKTTFYQGAVTDDGPRPYGWGRSLTPRDRGRQVRRRSPGRSRGGRPRSRSRPSARLRPRDRC